MEIASMFTDRYFTMDTTSLLPSQIYVIIETLHCFQVRYVASWRPLHCFQVRYTASWRPLHCFQVRYAASWRPLHCFQVRYAASWRPLHCFQVRYAASWRDLIIISTALNVFRKLWLIHKILGNVKQIHYFCMNLRPSVRELSGLNLVVIPVSWEPYVLWPLLLNTVIVENTFLCQLLLDTDRLESPVSCAFSCLTLRELIPFL